VLWTPPIGMRHLASLLTLLAFVLLAATYIPGNAIKARVHHPMVLSVKTWALAHLLATGTAAHLLLFGSFLIWAVLSFVAARRRDRAQRVVYAAGTLQATGLTLVVGIAAWAAFAFYLHGALIGIRPLG
ncbi:MAG: NnrU family protein, partial [Rhodoferax sp.]